MSDGNLQVLNSVSEDQMESAWSVFDRMRNAVIEGSKLASEFVTLRAEVEALRRDIEYVRATNQRLDRDMFQLQRDRDQVAQELAQAKQELTQAQRSISLAEEDNRQWQAQFEKERADKVAAEQLIQELQRSLEEARKERDQHKSALDGIKGVLSSYTTALGLPDPSTPTVQAQSPEVVAPEVATQDPSSPSGEHTPDSGASDDPYWYTDSTGRRQPRDPVTQQWRSPYHN